MNCINCKTIRYNILVVNLKKIYHFLIKTLLCFILFLFLAILSKSNHYYGDLIKKNLYQEQIQFSSIKKFYNKYLGGIFPLELKISQNTNYVFNEKITYSKSTPYQDGAKLTVSENYLVPSLYNGTVVYLGEKEHYGKVIIIENDEGIDMWYGNLCNSTIKLYDQIKKGDYLGASCDNTIYFVVTRKNKFLNYQDYLP